MFNYCKAQTCPSQRAGTALVYAVKALKKPPQVFGCNSRARIADCQSHVATDSYTGYMYIATFASVFYGVADKVAHGDLKQSKIALYINAVVAIDGNFVSSFFRSVLVGYTSFLNYGQNV